MLLKMAIVSPEYRKTKREIDDILANVGDDNIAPELLLMIDYAYHNTDKDYDDGLSFLDRLHRKLSLYFPIQWNVHNLKLSVRTSNNPAATFLDILNEILDDAKIACYGV